MEYYSQLEYVGGTPCDLTNTPRSTTVQFKCGPNDAILSIVEDHTCHYRVVVTTSYLCKHPAFVHRRPATRPVVCRQDQGVDNDE